MPDEAKEIHREMLAAVGSHTTDASDAVSPVEAKVDELAAQAGAELHKQRPNADKEPIDLKVEHRVAVTQHHFLVGNCPACGAEIKTDHPGAIQAFEQGKPVRSHCECGQRFTVPGRSRLIKPKDAGRVVGARTPPQRMPHKAIRGKW